MSCFNSIANCCPPEPPPEDCCITPAQIASLFPSGLTVGIAGTTVLIPNTGWEVSTQCCAVKTVFPTIASIKNCTSDWSYTSSEKTKCESSAAKLRTNYVSVDPDEITCDMNQCPEIILAARTSTLIQEKAERVVTSEFKILSITVSVGKFSRLCGSSGTPVCVYAVGISVYIEVDGGGVIRKYKRAVNELEYLDADLVACCNVWSMPPPTVADLKAQWYKEEVTGVDQFPLCNSLPEDSVQLLQTLNISRTKVMTSLTSPLTFSKDDPAPEFCDRDTFCLPPTNSGLSKVTVTFNRTLPPAYEIKTFSTALGNEKCCVSRVITDVPTPPEAYDIYGPNLWTTSGRYYVNNPSPGKEHLTSNLPPNCYPILGLGSCMCGIPDGVGWKAGLQCCPYPTLPVIWPNYESDGEFKFTDNFSYNSVTGINPIIHEYPIGSWTLTF